MDPDEKIRAGRAQAAGSGWLRPEDATESLIEGA